MRCYLASLLHYDLRSYTISSGLALPIVHDIFGSNFLFLPHPPTLPTLPTPFFYCVSPTHADGGLPRFLTSRGRLGKINCSSDVNTFR